MALGENQNKIQYTVTTSDDSFEFPYKYWGSSNIIVTKLASGIETNPAFTISPTNGDPENGGTVTLTSAVTSCTITIERVVPFASEADYKRGALSPDSLTENFDKSAAMSQQLSDEITRSLKIPTTDPAGLTYDIGTVAVRKNTVLGFDASGNTSNIDLVESGTVGVETDFGLTIASNIISVNADGTSIGFDGVGAVEVLDDGITTAKILDANVTTEKIASPTGTDTSVVTGTAGADGQLAGWNADGDAVDSGYSVIDDDTMATAADTNIPTSESVKAYVDTVSGNIGNTQNFTPVLSQGTTPTIGIANSYYVKLGNFVIASYRITGAAGTAGTAGTAMTITLPTTAASSATITGSGHFIDDSANDQWTVSCQGDGATTFKMLIDSVSGGFVGSTPNVGFAENDQIRLQVMYYE